MDMKQLLEQFLTAGKTLADKGQAMAEDKLGIPESGEERDAVLSSMGKGALMAGVLAALVGTSGGRKLTGAALKLGGLAALGGIGYKAYQNWQGDKADGTPVHELTGKAADDRSLLLLRAMVGAANADGHIDADEQEELKKQIMQMSLPEDMVEAVKAIVAQPPTAQELIAQANTATEANEVYLATRLFVGPDSSQVERDYLRTLVEGLQLNPELLAELDSQLDKEA